VATGTLLSAINVTGISLKEQRVAFLGFGGAGMGIAQLMRSAMRDAGLSDQAAGERFYAVDRYGLIVEGGQGIRPEQQLFARKRSEVAGWQVSNPQEIGLLDVVRHAKPTVTMIKASALALAALSPTREEKRASLLPPLSNICSVSLEVAKAVGKQAMQDGLAAVDKAGSKKELAANVWTPVYQAYVRAD
jgi:malic enzyme